MSNLAFDTGKSVSNRTNNVHVLESFFTMDRQMATKVMLEVHSKGKGICGIFPYDLAETKASQVIEYARKNEHPLICTVETEE